MPLGAFRLNSLARLIAQESGASDFTPAGTLFRTLDNPNPYGTGASDRFGFSCDIDGNIAIVGAYTEDDAGGSGSGKAYIFDVATGNLLHTLDNPNDYGTTANDNFGASVAISGNYALVTASGEDTATDFNSGIGYIFDVTTGNLLHTLDNPNPYGTATSDGIGGSAKQSAMSGNYAIISTYNEDDVSANRSGAAYIFDVTTGNLLHTLTNPNDYGTKDEDRFGFSCDIDGNYAIVGAYYEDTATDINSGVAYIFDVTTGNLLHTLDNPNAYGTPLEDRLGYSVGISGNYAIASAYLEDDASGTNSGAAYIFDVTTGNLLHTLTNPNNYGTSENDTFGFITAISGNYALVGAHNEDDITSTSAGVVYVFDVATGNLLHTIENPNAYGTTASDNFGYHLAAGNGYFIVTAYQEDTAADINSGVAYVFN